MIEIRRFTNADQAAVVKLHNDALGPTGAHLGPGPWDDDLKSIDTAYLDAGGEFLVGVHGGQLVAMGAFRRIDSRVAEIKRMRTLPRFQGRGFGRQLLGRLETRARQLGYEVLRLDTTDKQAAARHLYESEGYLEVGRVPGPGTEENILYEKMLVPS